MHVLCELFGFVICGHVTGKGRTVMGGTVEVGNYIHSIVYSARSWLMFLSLFHLKCDDNCSLTKAGR